MYTIIEYNRLKIKVHGHTCDKEKAILYAYSLAENESKIATQQRYDYTIIELMEKNEKIDIYSDIIAKYRFVSITPIDNNDINKFIDTTYQALEPKGNNLTVKDLIEDCTPTFYNTFIENHDITEVVAEFNEEKNKCIPVNYKLIENTIKIMITNDEFNMTQNDNYKTIKLPSIYAVRLGNLRFP